MKVVEETFRQLLQSAWCLWRKKIFVFIDEVCNQLNCLKSLIILLTSKINMCVTERGSLKNIRKQCISCFSKVVHNIKLPYAYSRNYLAYAE